MKASQTGWLIIGIFVPTILLLVYVSLKIGTEKLSPSFILLILVLTVCLIIFYKLTITIDNQQIRFWFGFGLIGKKYNLDDIKDCKAVTNSPLYGWGIRMLSNGWLYNVSGLKAIELTFKHSPKKVRIGTDKPDEIAAYINKLLTNQDHEIYTGNEKRNFHKTIVWSISIITFLSIVILFYFGMKEPIVKINSDYMQIKGMYGLTLSFKDINQIDTLSRLSKLSKWSLRTNGFAFGKRCKGHFNLEGAGNTLLFIKCGNPPYIHIKYNKQKNLYLNLNDRAATKALFQKIIAITSNPKPVTSNSN